MRCRKVSPGAARRGRAGRRVRPVSGEGVAVLLLAWKLFFGRGLALSYKEREGTVRCAGCGALPCRAVQRRAGTTRPERGAAAAESAAPGAPRRSRVRKRPYSVAAARTGAHVWAVQKNGLRPVGVSWRRGAGAGGRVGVGGAEGSAWPGRSLPAATRRQRRWAGSGTARRFLREERAPAWQRGNHSVR